MGVHSPPATGIAYTFQIPVLFDENRMRDSSAENEAPVIDVVSRNCSIVYCFDGRAVCADAVAAQSTRRAVHPDRRIAFIETFLLCLHILALSAPPARWQIRIFRRFCGGDRGRRRSSRPGRNTRRRAGPTG